MTSIKEEPDDSSKFFGGTQENQDPQKYYNKEELDLDLDEILDENNENSIKKPIEKSKARCFEKSKTILQNQNCQPKEVNIKIEKPDTDKDEINKNLDLQKYHYREELDLDWDENDNNYEETYETFVNKSIGRDKVIAAKTMPASVLRDRHSYWRKNNVKFENPYTEKECPRCKKRLKNLNTLQKHLFYCGKAPHLQCDSCSYKAKYKNTLIVHIMRNHPQQIQSLRKKKATQKERSKSEKNEEQSAKCSRYCVICNAKTYKPDSKKCRKCGSWLLYQCEKCYETLRTRLEFIRHMNNVCDPKGYYHCPACDYKSTYKGHVKTHLKVHLANGSQIDVEAIKWKKIEGTNESALSFTYPSCGKQYERNASLASHMRFCIKSQGVKKPPTNYVDRKKEEPGVEYKLSRSCAKCNKEVRSLKTYTSKCCGSMILLTCLKCSKSSEDSRIMYHHVRSICFKTKCDMCDYEGSKKAVYSHQKRKHDFNSVECPKCKRKQKNKFILQTHLRSCGKKKLRCQLCKYKTYKKDRLSSHISKNHPV